jgi:hypothetical protein
VAGVAAGGAPAGVGAAPTGAAGAGEAARAGGAAGTPPAASRLRSTEPTLTRWPARTWTFATRPPKGEGSSTCAFSVSTRRTGWSSCT